MNEADSSSTAARSKRPVRSAASAETYVLVSGVDRAERMDEPVAGRGLDRNIGMHETEPAVVHADDPGYNIQTGGSGRIQQDRQGNPFPA